jgi:hypothetical protein
MDLLALLFDWWLGVRDRDRRPSWQGIVPNLHGLPESVARRALSDCDLCVELVRLTEHRATVEDVVVGQSPAPRERADRRSTVTIYLQHPSAAKGANRVQPKVQP